MNGLPCDSERGRLPTDAYFSNGGGGTRLDDRAGETLSRSQVIARLEEAGSTLLALPSSGYATGMRVSHLDFMHEAQEAYGSEIRRIRPSVPSAAHITRMDEALGWLRIIPQSRYVLRRIVGARGLVSPITSRHLFSWRKLATVLGADHKAIQRWHSEGITLIVAALTKGGLVAK